MRQVQSSTTGAEAGTLRLEFTSQSVLPVFSPYG